jgi:hypothetical protein
MIKDEFCHYKPLSIKANARGNLGEIKVHEELALKEKGIGLTSRGSVKFWFPLVEMNNGYIYFQSNVEKIKIHYDNGIRITDKNMQNVLKYINFYGSY